ncbi:UNVERIFIED_CONTAM: hypothetical protein K2H54_043362 [Gekko kuhli]
MGQGGRGEPSSKRHSGKGSYVTHAANRAREAVPQATILVEAAADDTRRVPTQFSGALLHPGPHEGVHNKEAAKHAILKLNSHPLNACHIVELLRSRLTYTIKVFVGNVLVACTYSELCVLFQQYGAIAECNVFKGFSTTRQEPSAPPASPESCSRNTEPQGVGERCVFKREREASSAVRNVTE